jgi:hypothetical protein
MMLLLYTNSVTSLLAAFVATGTDALQVALAHLFFNITGIIIWYPIPFMRRIPLYMARQMGKATRLWKGFPIVYILIMFIVVPLGLMGLSSLFGINKTSTIIASIIVAVIIIVLVVLIYWLNFNGGRWVIGNYLKARQRNADTVETLPYDIVYVERKIKELQDYTSCEEAPMPTISSDVDQRSIFTHVSDDIDHAFNMVNSLVKHSGLNPNTDKDLDNGSEKFGRYLHKEKEIMPADIGNDTSNWMKYQLIISLTSLVIIGLIIWGITVLFIQGSTGYNSMGGLITVLLCLFILIQFYSYFFDNGKSKSLDRYKDKELHKHYKAEYTKTMAQINADLDLLARHTNLPALDADHAAPSGNGDIAHFTCANNDDNNDCDGDDDEDEDEDEDEDNKTTESEEMEA